MKVSAPKISKPPTSGDAEKIISRDVELMARSYKREFPMVVKSIEGPLVEDINGNIYIDFTSGFGLLPLGGRHPEIQRAIKDQLEKLASYSLKAAYSQEALEFAEELSKILPIRGDVRMILTDSFSEAVDAAIRGLRWHTGKRVVAGFLGAYHGSTQAALSLSTDSRARRISTGVEDVIYVPPPLCSRCFFGLKPENCQMTCIDYFRRLVEAVAPEDLAAVFLEPIQVEAGVVIPPEGYLQRLSKMIKEVKSLLVANEFSTAPARTGRWFALDHWNINADAIILGAQFSSGLPLGVFAAREDLLDLEPDMYESVTGGCQLSLAAALATLRVIKDEGLVERSERFGRNLRKRLSEIVEEAGVPWQVRGLGMLLGIEVIGGDSHSNVALAEEIVRECFRVGLLVRRKGSTIILTPPLNVDEELLEKGVEILEEKLLELSRRSPVSSS